MNKNMLQRLLDEFDNQYEINNTALKEAKNISELCSLYAKYCGHLESILIAMQIELKER